MHSILAGLVALLLLIPRALRASSALKRQAEVFGDRDGAVEGFRSALEPGSANGWLRKPNEPLSSLSLTSKEDNICDFAG